MCDSGLRWAAIRVNMYGVSGASSFPFKVLIHRVQSGWRDSVHGDGLFRAAWSVAKHPGVSVKVILLASPADSIGLALRRAGLISFASIIQKHWTKKCLFLTCAEERVGMTGDLLQSRWSTIRFWNSLTRSRHESQ